MEPTPGAAAVDFDPSRHVGGYVPIAPVPEPLSRAVVIAAEWKRPACRRGRILPEHPLHAADRLIGEVEPTIQLTELEGGRCRPGEGRGGGKG